VNCFVFFCQEVTGTEMNVCLHMSPNTALIECCL